MDLGRGIFYVSVPVCHWNLSPVQLIPYMVRTVTGCSEGLGRLGDLCCQRRWLGCTTRTVEIPLVHLWCVWRDRENLDGREEQKG